MQNKKNNWNPFEEAASHIYVILALFALAIDTVICSFSGADPFTCGIITIVIYGIVSLTVYIFTRKRIRAISEEEKASNAQSQSVVNAFRTQIKLPYAVVKENGKIVTVNQAFLSAINSETSIFDLDINTVCGINLSELLSTSQQTEETEESKYGIVLLRDVKKAETAFLGDRKFRMECYPIASKGATYYMIVFHDITELDEVSTQYKNKHVAIGYIIVDNLEEIAQYVKVNYQDETRKVGKILAQWASELGGTLREYQDNKFLLLLTQEMLSESIRTKFSILSEIHKIEIGDSHIPLTVSMGIATTGDTLEDREHDAMVSLDMAMQRGGDQVVLKAPTGLFYYGATNKTLQKRTRGHGKIIYAKLAALINVSSNVLIMGHKNPDFDSIGACIGMYTLIRNMHENIDVKIVIDKNSDNFIACTSRLSMLSEYQNAFIDGVSAIDLNSSETLLIIVDVNNLNIVESPELAANAFQMAIIDHHIKKDEFLYEPSLLYIDPSASSTCELVSEILEETLSPDITFNEEANVMMSGIMLDTKNFTRTVGMRTFAAALYLKNAGADTEYARTFFEEEIETYQSEAEFVSHANIYRDCIAIATAVDIGMKNSRVLAAKAADKLLSAKNVNAAFTLTQIGENVNVSARSNGSINVQLIAEQLGGGGHFDMAGALITNATLEDAEFMLKQAIDNHFENLKKESDSD